MYVYMYIYKTQLISTFFFAIQLIPLLLSPISHFQIYMIKNIRLDPYHGAFSGGRFLRPEKHIIDSLLHFILIYFLLYILFSSYCLSHHLLCLIIHFYLPTCHRRKLSAE